MRDFRQACFIQTVRSIRTYRTRSVGILYEAVRYEVKILPYWALRRSTCKKLLMKTRQRKHSASITFCSLKRSRLDTPQWCKLRHCRSNTLRIVFCRDHQWKSKSECPGTFGVSEIWGSSDPKALPCTGGPWFAPAVIGVRPCFCVVLGSSFTNWYLIGD